MTTHQDDVDSYWPDISRTAYEPLSREAEQKTFRELHNGNREAALRRIVEANIRFVVSVAYQYQHRGLPLADLIAIGNCGLLEAVERFDPDRGFKFITYAVWWIRQAIRKALSEQVGAARRPVSLVADHHNVTASADCLAQTLGRRPTTSEIVAVSTLSEKRVCDVVDLDSSDLSLDAEIFDGDRLWSSKFGQEDPELDLDIDVVVEALRILSQREKFIVCLCYGLTGQLPMSLEQVGEQIGLTRERVRQVRNVALEKLRRNQVLQELAA